MRQKWLCCLTGLAAALLLAGQALAATLNPPTLYLPPTPDADGIYRINWGGGISGSTYVLEEATASDYSNAAVVYSGTYTYRNISGKAPGTYYYRLKATKTGYTDSAYRNGAYGIVVLDPATVPVNAVTTLYVPATDADGKYRVYWKASATSGASYTLQEATDAGFSTNVITYPSSTVTYRDISGKASASYYYRVQATKTGNAPSAWTAGGNAVVVTLPIGSATCLTCHSGGAGGTQGTVWAASRHGNSNSKPGATAATGTCARCHNASNEYATLGRPAVGCESCHGTQGTSDHPTTAIGSTAAISSCRACHNAHGSAVTNLVTKVNGGKHAIAANTHNSATCNKCHSVEGNLDYRNGVTVRSNAPSGPSCAVCHDSHTAQLRDPQYSLCTGCHQTSGFYHASAWSRDITSTHIDDPATGVGLASNVIEGYVLRTASANPCLDCHGHEFLTETGNLERTGYAGFDNLGAPKTYYGYLQVANHKSTLHTAWAQSAHAGGLLKAKYAAQESYPKKDVVDGQGTILATGTYDFSTGMTTAVKAAGVTDAPTGNAWAHYNWDQTSSRGACQRCHTATGAANFLTKPATYNAASNDFSHLSGWTAATGSPQNEVLYCWGCHSSVETGALRNPGGITEVYAGSPTGSPSITVTYPNVGASNVCMGCHLGREVGAVVAASTGDFTNLSFINSHYLAAGATIFNESGYEYAGQSYDNLGYHKSVGVGNAYSTGNDGPCVACHMSGAKSHSFEVVTEDTNGVITAITSAACGNCHGGLTAAILETSKEEFHTALAALESALEAKGIYFYPAHPYFYKDPNGDGFDPATEAISANAFKNWDGVYPGKGKDVMGAAFNYNLLEHDPGAYAHNRGYALKLIADSIDFLADGAVDGQGIPASVTDVINSNAFASATTHTSSAVSEGGNNCAGCHQPVSDAYATSQHKTKQGKSTWYNDHLGNTEPTRELQTGFGNYVTVAYDSLPCKNCHNGSDNGPWDSNPAVGANTQSWPGANCTECHTNRTTYGVQSTTPEAPVTKTTCYGCHSRQKKEAAPTANGGAGLVDVHTNGIDDDGDGQVEDLACLDCHSTADMHGTGSATTSQLQWGTISAQCENCHGAGTSQGPLTGNTAHNQHLDDIACSTCHLESMVTCNNCHFDNEMGGTGITKLKFASGFFGGTKASGKSWRYLVNRVMPDGSTKIYPGSMQSLYTDVYAANSPGSGTVAGQGDDIGWSHAGIAPYYSHSITRVNALTCNDCHGTQKAIDLANGTPVRVITWSGTDTETVAPSALGTKLSGPVGVIPVPENPKGKLLMDFVDLVDPGAALNAAGDNIVSYRKLAKRNGPDSIHMPEAFVKPLTQAQLDKLAIPQP